MILLGEILKNATNLTIDDLSKKYLFEPLAVDTFEWAVKFDNGVDANTLKLRPPDMLKIGITFLDQGVWKGERIISKTWVYQSAHAFGKNKGINIPGEASGRNGYSYSWWIKTFRHHGEQLTMFSAGGWGGQHIMVIPAIKTVIVFTGGNYVTRRPPYKILKKFILPAVG